MFFQFMCRKVLLHGTYHRKIPWILTYVLDWLYCIQCLTSLFSINHLFLSICIVFDAILCNINNFLLINPSANVFVFEDFNVNRKDWLTYSGGTDRCNELCYISQMTLHRCLTLLLGSLTVTLTILLF